MQAATNRYPGRLRLRFNQLRRQPLYAAQVAASLRALDGVLSVDANAITGGLLIVYDVVQADRGGLWPALKDTLATHGLRESDPQQAPQAGAAPGAASGAAWPEKLAEKVVGAMVEKLVERSALALVAALL